MTRNQSKVLAVVVVVALVVAVALSACDMNNKGGVTDEIYLKCTGPCELYYFEDETGREVKTDGKVNVIKVSPPLR